MSSIGVMLGLHPEQRMPLVVSVSPLQLVVLNRKLRCIEIQVPNDDVLLRLAIMSVGYCPQPPLSDAAHVAVPLLTVRVVVPTSFVMNLQPMLDCPLQTSIKLLQLELLVAAAHIRTFGLVATVNVVLPGFCCHPWPAVKVNYVLLMVQLRRHQSLCMFQSSFHCAVSYAYSTKTYLNLYLLLPP